MVIGIQSSNANSLSLVSLAKYLIDYNLMYCDPKTHHLKNNGYKTYAMPIKEMAPNRWNAHIFDKISKEEL